MTIPTPKMYAGNKQQSNIDLVTNSVILFLYEEGSVPKVEEIASVTGVDAKEISEMPRKFGCNLMIENEKLIIKEMYSFPDWYLSFSKNKKFKI